MHPLENGMGVPAFLAKLWRLVEDAETNDLISWSQDGRSFVIQNQAKFAKELLPLNYKHNNMASFIRQLNMYGFHKITSIDNGGLKFDRDEMEFSHPYFQKGHPYLLEHIKRKIAKQAETEKSTTKVETVNRVLNEVKNMRGRQDSLDTRFSAMKQENEALWREVAILRQKHMKQQQIVNKLIQFLVTLVQPSRSGLNSSIGKRRYQLMINDAPQSKLKKPNPGPIIRELTEELLDDVDSDLELDPINIANVQSPGAESQSSKDQDGATSGCSADGLGLDDIDEIDTNNMEIYSGAPIKIKKERNVNQPQMKQEPNDTDAISSAAGKSLLIPPQNNDGSKEQQDTEELMLDILSGQTNDNLIAGTSGVACSSDVTLPNSLTSQNGLFDVSSQPPENILADDDLFPEFAPKQTTTTITKYNPKTASDIMKLESPVDYSTHLENVQNDLESLKDLLRGDNYQMDSNLLGNVELPVYLPQGSFDADTINKLFGNDDIIGYEMSPSNMDMFTGDGSKKDGENIGNRSELMNYQPSPYNNSLDLNELLQNVGDVEPIHNE
nr:heat shock factor [Prodiamesa olivacea]